MSIQYLTKILHGASVHSLCSLSLMAMVTSSCSGSSSTECNEDYNCGFVADPDAGKIAGCERWDFVAPKPLTFNWFKDGGVEPRSGDVWVGAMSSDESILFGAAWHSDSVGRADLLAFSRKDMDSPFGVPRSVHHTVESEYPSFARTLEDKSIELWFAQRVNGGSENYIQSALFNSSDMSIGAISDHRKLSEEGDWQNDVWINSDGTRLYLATNFNVVHHYDNVGTSWEQRAAVFKRSGIRDFTMSPDELEIIYDVTGPSRTEIWYSRRTSVDETFEVGRRLTHLHSDDIDEAMDSGFPVLSDDGNRLYFNYDENIAKGNNPGARAYVASRICVDE